MIPGDTGGREEDRKWGMMKWRWKKKLLPQIKAALLRLDSQKQKSTNLMCAGQLISHKSTFASS